VGSGSDGCGSEVRCSSASSSDISSRTSSSSDRTCRSQE
jgi:hypothetical protein